MNYNAKPEFLPFAVPIPQIFGIGASKQLGDKLKGFGCKKVMVVYDKGVEAAGISTKIVGYIKEAGIECVTFNGVLGDPPSNVVDEAGAIAVKEKVDGVVAVGGGSCLDTAKGIRLLTTNEGPISKYFDLTLPQKPGVPLVAIPTTSGTGSEVSNGSVITDIDTHIKRVVVGAGTPPTLSITDPELIVGVPAPVTAACAFDALAHALDAVFSRVAGPMVKIMAAEGIKLFRKSLIPVYEDGSNLEARAEMALAANIGGICIATGRCNITHALAHNLGAMYHVSHGVACAIFTPACLEYIAEYMPDEVRMVADLFEVEYDASDSTSTIANKTALALYNSARSVNIPWLKDYVANAEDAYKIIPGALQDMFAKISPRPFDEAAAKWVIDTTYGYELIG